MYCIHSLRRIQCGEAAPHGAGGVRNGRQEQLLYNVGVGGLKEKLLTYGNCSVAAAFSPTAHTNRASPRRSGGATAAEGNENRMSVVSPGHRVMKLAPHTTGNTRL